MPNSTPALLADADLCVKCGLCLPHCPTYQLHRHEADGPRGRIALAQGLLTGTLPASESLTSHLDSCLSCRACETVCPAKVPYGRVLDGARAALATPQRTRSTRLISAALDSSALRTVLRLLLWLVSWLPTPAWLERQLPAAFSARPVPRRLRSVAAPARGAVALFTGCVSDIAERGVLADALQLFKAAGVAAAIPPGQVCCGALHQHGGLPEQAAQRAAGNAVAFADASTVLPLASGCGAALRDLGQHSRSDHAPLGPKVQDLCATLADALDAQPPAFKPLKLRVGLHVACTQAHVFGQRQAIRRLLERIPGIELLELAPESGCCGAAGTAFISQPAQAAALLAPKLDAAAAVDVIVSANIGCSLHFLAGLRQRGVKLEVLHPVSLLARALP